MTVSHVWHVHKTWPRRRRELSLWISSRPMLMGHSRLTDWRFFWLMDSARHSAATSDERKWGGFWGKTTTSPKRSFRQNVSAANWDAYGNRCLFWENFELKRERRVWVELLMFFTLRGNYFVRSKLLKTCCKYIVYFYRNSILKVATF